MGATDDGLWAILATRACPCPTPSTAAMTRRKDHVSTAFASESSLWSDNPSMIATSPELIAELDFVCSPCRKASSAASAPKEPLAIHGIGRQTQGGVGNAAYSAS